MDPTKSLQPLQLTTILPPVLRVHTMQAMTVGNYYCQENNPMKFVYLDMRDKTSLRVQIGYWCAYNGKSVILFKDRMKKEGPGKCHWRFDIEDPCLLRQDEFEWLREYAISHQDYGSLVDNILLNQYPNDIIIFNHIDLIARKLNILPCEAFFMISRTIDYNPEALMKEPWIEGVGS